MRAAIVAAVMLAFAGVAAVSLLFGDAREGERTPAWWGRSASPAAMEQSPHTVFVNDPGMCRKRISARCFGHLSTQSGTRNASTGKPVAGPPKQSSTLRLRYRGMGSGEMKILFYIIAAIFLFFTPRYGSPPWGFSALLELGQPSSQQTVHRPPRRLQARARHPRLPPMSRSSLPRPPPMLRPNGLPMRLRRSIGLPN
jgi:hypothetical protein